MENTNIVHVQEFHNIQIDFIGCVKYFAHCLFLFAVIYKSSI